jgi:hypothetical protein
MNGAWGLRYVLRPRSRMQRKRKGEAVLFIIEHREGHGYSIPYIYLANVAFLVT